MSELKLITIEQAAEMLNIKISRVRQAIFRREVDHIKLGALVRFRESHIYDWIKRQTVKSTALLY